jgi:nucleotidyltransferase substrate binding protein (TIGR01987 family)
MDKQEIRWVQRLESYRKALAQLDTAVGIVSSAMLQGDELMLMKDGLIQRYEFTLELAWKVMKDYEEYQGGVKVGGPRDVIRQAHQFELIDDDYWITMMEDRNLTSHTYEESKAQEVVMIIINTYLHVLHKLEQRMTEREAQL